MAPLKLNTILDFFLTLQCSRVTESLSLNSLRFILKSSNMISISSLWRERGGAIATVFVCDKQGKLLLAACQQLIQKATDYSDALTTKEKY